LFVLIVILTTILGQDDYTAFKVGRTVVRCTWSDRL